MKLTERFSVSGLWVSSHSPLSDFYASSWQRGRSAVPLLLARVLLAAAAIAILTWSIYEAPNRYWLIYLTNWGLVFVVVVLLNGVVISVLAVRGKIDDEDELPWYVRSYWFMFNVSLTVAIMITALYWILIYDAEVEEQLGLNLATHAGNSLIMVCELMVSRTPVRLLHLYQPLGVGLWYAGFSAVYYLAGGTDANENPYIYEVLDWRQSAQAGGIVGVSAGGLMLIYMVVWGVAITRDWASIALVRTKSHDLPYTPSDNDLQTRIV